MTASKAALMTIFAGLLFYSSWMPTSRLALPKGGALPILQWRKPAVPVQRGSTQERLSRAHRLGDVMRDPSRLSKTDLQKARADWGAEAPRMLGALKRSAH